MIDPDGRQQEVVEGGFHPQDEPARTLLNEAFADPASTASQTHQVAVDAGVPIPVRTGQRSHSGSIVTGGATSGGLTVQGIPTVGVTIDTTDKVFAEVLTTNGAFQEAEILIEDIVEHELGNQSHVVDFLEGGEKQRLENTNKSRAVDGESAFRIKKGRGSIRLKHDSLTRVEKR